MTKGKGLIAGKGFMGKTAIIANRVRGSEV